MISDILFGCIAVLFILAFKKKTPLVVFLGDLMIIVIIALIYVLSFLK